MYLPDSAVDAIGFSRRLSDAALRLLIAPLLVLTISGCGGGGGGTGGGGGSGGGGTTYTIGGTLSGATGAVVLQNNAGNNLSVAANGSFVFSTALAGGAAYAVTVLTPPTGQTCTVASASGTVATANVTSVSVTCASLYTVGGTATGLTGSLVLQNNGGNNLMVPSNGSFTFTTSLASGAAYAVTVLTPPAGQTCTVHNGAGNVGTANVAGVSVDCTHTSSNGTLSGTYNGVGYGIANTGSGQVFFSALATATLNNGSVTSTAIAVDFNGTIPPGPFTPTSATYSTTPSGGVTFTPATGNSTSGGILGADGNAYVLMDLTANSPPSIGVAVKAGTGVTQASLAGKYTLVSIGVGAHNAESDLTTLTVDASGNNSGSGITNKSGTITTSTLSGVVTVDSGGILSSNGGSTKGAISANLDLLALEDVAPGDSPFVTYGVKQGTAVTLATISGSYTAVAYAANLAGGAAGTSGSLAKVVFDGKGAFSLTATHNDSGTISTDTSSGTYTVQADGTLIFSGGTTYHGAVSADGNALVLVDIASGSQPEIAVAVRQ